MNYLLRVESLSKHAAEDQGILSTITFSIHPKERLGIVGETGSGKTTLLQLLAGLQEPDTGEIHFEDKKVMGPSKKLVPGHKRISYLSQHFELPKFIRVKEHLHYSNNISNDEAENIFHACRITHLLERHTGRLSGGEKQRIALAKALLKKPKMLLLDEPFSNLDFNHKRIIKEALEGIDRNLDVTITMVAHDPKDILSWADKIMVLKAGEMVQLGPPQLLYDHPVSEYVAGLFGSYNLVSLDDWPISTAEFTTINNRTLIRPNQLEITHGTTMKEGEIVRVDYYGSYEELLIKIGKDGLFVHSKPHLYKMGDRVNLKINQRNDYKK